jgi:ribose transport system substrate-binding protein
LKWNYFSKTIYGLYEDGFLKKHKGGKIMKKILVIIFAVIFTVAFVTACSGQAQTPTATSSAPASSAPASTAASSQAPAAEKKLVVGFAALTLGNSWNVQTYESLKAAVARHPEIDKIQFGNSEANPDKQINDIRNMIDQKVDVILIEACSETALNPVIEEAVAAGIPVVVADSLVTSDKVTSQVAPDQKKWGEETAKWLIEKMGGKGNIVVLNGIAGNSSNNDRWGGAKKIFDQNTNVKILADANCDWDQAKAQPVVANWLAAYPQIDGVWSQGGAMTAAAMLEFQKAKRPLVPMVGEAYNGFMRVWTENKNAGYSGIACVLPNYDIQIALELALKAKKGETVPKFVDVPLTLIYDNDTDKYFIKDKPDDYWMVNDMEPAQIEQVIKDNGKDARPAE